MADALVSASKAAEGMGTCLMPVPSTKILPVSVRTRFVNAGESLRLYQSGSSSLSLADHSGTPLRGWRCTAVTESTAPVELSRWVSTIVVRRKTLRLGDLERRGMIQVSTSTFGR